MENKMITINASALPVKTWRYLKINESSIPAPEKINGKGKLNIQNNAQNVSVSDGDFSKLEKLVSGKEIEGALGNTFCEWFKNQNVETKIFSVKENTGAQIGADCGIEKSVLIKLELSPSDEYAGLFVIQAEKNTASNFVFDFSSKSDGKNKTAFAAVRIICLLEENAGVKLSHAQFLDKNVIFASDIVSCNAKNAKLSVVRANFGAEKSWLALKSYLNGKEAEVDDQLAYMSDGSECLDINNIARHTGERSKSNFNAQGVLLGKAYKNYKGTIDFIRGCAGSEGNELEDVLILSDEAVNKTTPIILCDEEDVVGNHGATLGKIDENLLFYMASRGISKEKARQMVANGKLCSIINLIPDNEVAEKALKKIDSAFEAD